DETGHRRGPSDPGDLVRVGHPVNLDYRENEKRKVREVIAWPGPGYSSGIEKVDDHIEREKREVRFQSHATAWPDEAQKNQNGRGKSVEHSAEPDGGCFKAGQEEPEVDLHTSSRKMDARRCERVASNKLVIKQMKGSKQAEPKQDQDKSLGFPLAQQIESDPSQQRDPIDVE